MWQIILSTLHISLLATIYHVTMSDYFGQTDFCENWFSHWQIKLAIRFEIHNAKPVNKFPEFSSTKQSAHTIHGFLDLSTEIPH